MGTSPLVKRLVTAQISELFHGARLCSACNLINEGLRSVDSHVLHSYTSTVQQLRTRRQLW